MSQIKLTCSKCVVFSRNDIASMNILNSLVNIGKFRESNLTLFGEKVYIDESESNYLVIVNKDLLYLDNLDSLIVSELFIFASRHESVAKKPSLLVHVPGNWLDDVRYGGKPRSVCIAPPYYLTLALRKITQLRKEYNLHNWLVSYEATHHGPYIDTVPTLFIEIGSTEEEWKNKKASEVIAYTILHLLESSKYYIKDIICVGIGGPHYAPKFTSLALRENRAFGHIVPEYVLNEVTVRELKLAIERNSEKVMEVVLDWKGMKGGVRQRIFSTLQELSKVYGFKIIKR